MCRAAEAGKTALSAIMFDIDHFKKINDTFGHEVGDTVLSAVGAQMTMTDGLLGRLGGEEFCVLGTGELADAWEYARELQRSLKALRFDHNGEAFGITCSFGIAEWEPGDAIDRMLRRADVAMYESKKSGRDRITASDTFAATRDHDQWSGTIRTGAARA
jgi:diguanylate cyclase (GGDEF)-like protein